MLPHISVSQFDTRLKKRKMEHVDTIRSIESILRKARGSVFTLPKPGSPVVLLLSGGLDSIVSWAILMEEFGLHVYPLSLDRGERRRSREVASISFFSSLYRKRYPQVYHEPYFTSLGGASLHIPIERIDNMLHPKVLFEHINSYGEFVQNISLGKYLMLPLLGRVYAEYLYFTANLPIRTIFCSIVSSDGILVPHQTFTATRSIMAHLCMASNDYSWQYASVAFERSLGLFLDKSDLIRWASSRRFPLEKTWSCYNNGQYQCGENCVACRTRRASFKLSGVADPTRYVPFYFQTVRHRCKCLLLHMIGRRCSSEVES